MKKKYAVIIFLLILVLIASCAPSPKEEAKEEPKGNLFLERTWMEALDGETLSLKEFEGNVVIIDFWASWCGPCRASIPFYMKMYDKYASQGLTVIGVNVNETKEEIESFVSESGMNYTMAFFNDDLNAVYKVTGIPAVFIFDKKGNKVANFTGYSSESDAKIEEIIISELGK
ncbi:TPA: hypothetical protein DCW38_04265 [candidate division WOR-3 bacterium]|jgi:thiol-disulfide isomerase/thioredoxin|uniref:Thioredoxin domain-containing protein n=1 Tax=candidate division WOR-3 bacterium TaxID=2052148 RepID=A0A350HA11_UNCW3|nr:hypothetical protein [candidate division WOR-3 bacterium]